ncbi:hypothetical protein Taro_056242 [Colocasia esculenta]|uniref:non-specific serine/threonine protein kinase n=1 Tax=Colocasia esculenta TaxID=4460 RepID=A0A843XTC9_COLES|nr:hypothetical protein [Colocasia esculenta]
MFPSLLPLLLLFLCSYGGTAGQKTDADELAILLDVKAALGSATTALDSWLPGGNPCSFPGVLCDARGSVSEIDLSHRRLSGTIPFKSLCRLSSLVRLWLGDTGVSGEVSAELGACTGMRFLDLAYNSLSGEIPDLSPLQNLRVLNLSGNGFTGSFPWASLARMPELYSLYLGDNPFNQTAGFPEEVLGRTKLQWLYLTNCSIHGVIPPGIGKLTGLVNLELADNQLYGKIPPEISRLTSLWQLELYNNSLTGELPRGFGGLANLTFFDASTNNLVGNLSEIRFLTKLASLQLFENDFSGEVPAELGEFRDLVNLSLYTNRLSGSLPAALGSWAEFNFIDVSTNLLTGPIPPDMCKRGTMKKLLMLENQFTGEIPATYANCTSLERFRVSNNSLSGEVPAGIWSLPNVNIIDLKSNQFSGSIGASIGKAKGLSQLFISHNQFSGELPAEIAGASSLVSVDASYNQLSGEVPASIGDLKALVSLYLQGNRLGGEIPDSLGSCSSLTQVNLAENSLSGRIPASLGRLSNLNSLNLSTNDLSGNIPGSLGSLKLSFLDVSGNLLTGAVPPALAIEAFSNGFVGNPGLCGYGVRSLRSCSPYSSPSSRDRLRTVVTCLLVAAAVAFAIFGYFVYMKRRRAEKESHRGLFSGDSWDMKSFRVVSFEEQEIINAVRQENLIGKGGSGSVYRVDLVGGKTVAVKHIWNYLNANKGDDSGGGAAAMLGGRRRRSREGLTTSREFEAEVTTLSAIRHVNVVKLFCSITSEDSSLLVYEFMPNGSLWDRLHTCEGGKLGGLDWDTRYEVALGAARGLEYLHHGLQRPIIHRDVKSSNILLDESFKPCIADFGLAKILHGQAATAAPSLTSDASSTHVVAGTHGYIAPEYAYTLKVNEKSDVYSFGVVLLELVTGRRPIEPDYGDNKDIVYWVYSNMTCMEGVMELVDKRIPAWAREEAMKVLRVGVLCTMRLPTLRPSMRAVVQMLEEVGQDRLAPAPAPADGGVRDYKEGKEPDPKQEKQRATPQ